MKKKNWFLILLIIVCLVVFYGYKTMARMKVDTQAPEIYMGTEVPEVSVKDPKTALLQGIEAEDNKDGDVTASLVVESVSLKDDTGLLEVTCAAFDRAGNVSKAQREARYADYESPRFTMSGPLFYRYGSNFDVLKTLGATDVIDGDIQHRVRATLLEEQSIAEMGTHNVEFRVTNSLGDTVSHVFPVEVYDPEAYEAALTLKKYVLYLDKGSTFSAQTYLNTFTLRGEETDLQGNLPYGYALKTEGTVNTGAPGVYPVKYQVTYTVKHATDPERDQNFTGCSKLIVVVEG